MDNNPLFKWIKILTLLTTILAMIVVLMGAYTRLKDAGLGCPDWPGCYGFLSVPESAEDVSKANSIYPDQPVEAAKAWPEMIHRYMASSLGVFILVIAGLAIANRKEKKQPVKLPIFLVILVIFQGLLGMWTVTMMLNPLIVMGHLLGGFTTLCLLALLYLRLPGSFNYHNNAALRGMIPWALLGLVVVFVQIALGGWTSANYAATACTQFPVCEGDWSANLNWSEAFKLWGHQVATYQYGVLEYSARMTIHIVHRFGALISTVLLLWIILRLWMLDKDGFYKKFSALLFLVLFTQVALGISNVYFQLPLHVAVAHNGVAVFLLIVLAALNYSLRIKPEQYL